MGLFGRWLVAGLVVAAATAGGADAATITVSTIADETTPGDGSCSLREAVAAANLGASTTDCALSGTGPTTIVLSAHSYPLSILPSGIDDDRFGDLNATGTMTIDGGGHATITAQNASDRALDV